MNMRLSSGNILAGLKSALRSKAVVQDLLFLHSEEDPTNPERKGESYTKL